MGRLNGGKKRKKIAELTENEKKALDLRIAGYNFREIAAAMECSVSTANDWVEKALKRSDEAMAKKGALFRELEAQRLDKLMATLWQSASSMATDSEERNRTIDRVLKIMERRAKMLGLDAPTRSELTGKDGKAIETKTEVVGYDVVWPDAKPTKPEDDPGDAGDKPPGAAPGST